ncbi:MurR/RpiR family transcriptional regulator [uncultured Vagococcus sp.]|uniref:MurR/RpiR family transcriptional regulator n=1 Tax=uncultured Vagococcus sp. TaxID=189676 RepID=UPI0028D38C1F|nr:MurR/RpiR family transcriptional regulator [uncultured Vagococcus sp.]
MLFLNRTPELTDLDFDIYKYITDHLEQTTYMTIRELADQTHTSTTTIQRFCQKFECKGFSEFKIRLRLYLQSRDQFDHAVTLDTSTYIDFLTRTTQPHFQKKIEAAIQLLINKELILFIGVGSSNVMAEYGALYFSSLFQMALRIEDPVTNPMSFLSKDLLDKTCVIALSVSGETPEVINYLSNLNFRNSNIISITNTANSTVAKLSNVNIPYYITKESLVEQDITSQLPVLFILESIARAIHNH